MKALITILLSLTFFLGGCSSLLDGQFVTKDGKESPFKPQVNQHEPIQAPSYRD
jgi:PBP1b-binding outer membrane lipoprotein LpoB